MEKASRKKKMFYFGQRRIEYSAVRLGHCPWGRPTNGPGSDSEEDPSKYERARGSSVVGKRQGNLLYQIPTTLREDYWLIGGAFNGVPGGKRRASERAGKDSDPSLVFEKRGKSARPSTGEYQGKVF